MPHPTKNKKKHQPREGDGINRHPRPLGLTLMNLNQLKQDNRTKLNERILNLYIQQGMCWMGKPKTITDMALYLNMQPEQLLRTMNKELDRLSLFFDGEEGMRLARVHYQNLLSKSLEILAQHQHQCTILQSQQGNEYVPFLTGEVNRSLANWATAMKPYMEVVTRLENRLQSPSHGKLASGAEKYISASEAITIMQNEPSMLTDKALVAAKEKEMVGLPEVNARYQDLTSIGIKYRGISPSLNPSEKDLKEPKRHDGHHERSADDTPNADDFIA